MQGEKLQLNRTLIIITLLPLFIFCLSACQYISPYSQFAYEQATSLKVESLALMDEATEPFSNHGEEVKELKEKIEKAYEYAKGMKHNEISARQWEILKDPNRNLLGGFLERWSKESTLGKAYVKEKKKQVGEAFDTIIGLESGKIKKSEIQ